MFYTSCLLSLAWGIIFQRRHFKHNKNLSKTVTKLKLEKVCLFEVGNEVETWGRNAEKKRMGGRKEDREGDTESTRMQSKKGGWEREGVRE